MLIQITLAWVLSRAGRSPRFAPDTSCERGPWKDLNSVSRSLRENRNPNAGGSRFPFRGAHCGRVRQAG